MITLDESKYEIIELLKQTERPGIDKLIEALEKSDYFTAPASTKFHASHPGGLALHSLRVLELFYDKLDQFETTMEYSSAVLCALLHDLCKVNVYNITEEPATDAQLKYLQSLLLKYPELTEEYQGITFTKAYASAVIEYLLGKTTQKPVKTIEYKYEETLPLGHSEKSLYMISKYIHLTAHEACVIRWHMGAYDASLRSGRDAMYDQAITQYPEVVLFSHADMESSRLKFKDSRYY